MQQNYKQARERSGLSLGDAAARLNISTCALRSYEADKNSPSALCLIGMCKLYGTTANELLDIQQ